jgi:hypothetical protein
MTIRSKFHSSIVVLAALSVVTAALTMGAPGAAAQDEAGVTRTTTVEEAEWGDYHTGEFVRRGAFAGLGFNWQVPGFQGPFLHEDYGKSWGFNARGGYRFLDWFAAEAIVEYADKFGANRAGSRAPSIRLLSSTVNAKFIVPVERFQPYLELGGGLLYADTGNGFFNSISDQDFGFAGRIGAGVDFFLTREISLFVDNSWTMSTDNTEDLYFYSLGGGARYNF